MVLLGIKQFKDPYYQGVAAQLAFYFLLSIFPTLIVLSQLLGLFSISLEVIGELINEYVDEDVVEILLGFIDYSPTGAMNVSFIIVALWSASKVQFSLIRIANYTITDGQSTGGGYFRDRLKAIKTILFTLFTITFALIILVYGEPILRLALSTIDRSLDVVYEIDNLLLLLRWPLALGLYFIMVSYNYYALPSQKVKFKEILPGSIFASTGMLLVTVLYSTYTTYVANFDIIYGSLATVVALMFWFFFLSWALVLGVLFNKVYLDTRDI
jgi:membrane protein